VAQKLNDARAELRHVGTTGPFNTAGWVQTGAYQPAIQEYQSALSMSEAFTAAHGAQAVDGPQIMTELGWLVARYEDAARGSEMIKSALRSAPANVDAKIRLAILAIQDNAIAGNNQQKARGQRIEEIKTWVGDYITAYPDRPDGHYLMGVVYSTTGELDSRNREYHLAIRTKNNWDRILWLYDGKRASDLYDALASGHR
jgi:tetratricopeptide (TPR) repeat protein